MTTGGDRKSARGPIGRRCRYLLALPLAVALLAASPARAGVLSTTDPAAIADFMAGRVVLDFDEIVVPAGPCFIPLERDHYLHLGIQISAHADASDETHVARLPACGGFGSTHTPPNIIGGGVSASAGWRETVRFDFPEPATAIGAHTDWSGSNTTLTAYDASGGVIASISGDQGFFLGIEEPGIAYAVWEWNFDQSVAGFSLDNVTFEVGPGAPKVPTLAPYGVAALVMLLSVAAGTRLTRDRR